MRVTQHGQVAIIDSWMEDEDHIFAEAALSCTERKTVRAEVHGHLVRE